MDKQQYEDGYRHGAASTQDQMRGAKDAQLDRERREREQREAWDRVRQQEEQLRRDSEAEQRRQQEQRAAEGRKAASSASSSSSGSSSTSSSSSSSKSSSSSSTGSAINRSDEGSGAQGFIGLLGFIGGAAFAYNAFADNWIAIVICGLIAAGIAAALYKFIIGVGVVVGALWLWVTMSDDSSQVSEAQPQQTALQSLDSTTVPSSAVELPTREIHFTNYCRFPIELAIAWVDGKGERRTAGYWSVPALAQDWRLLESGDQPVLSSDYLLAFAAHIPGQNYQWTGDSQYLLYGVPVNMMNLQMGVPQLVNYFTAAIQCDDFVPAETL